MIEGLGSVSTQRLQERIKTPVSDKNLSQSLITWFQNAESLQRAFSCKLIHLYPASTPNASDFHCLECTVFLTTNLDLKEHTSLKDISFNFCSNCKRHWPSGNHRFLEHTVAFMNPLFHCEVHMGLLEKANNNQACCYSILPKSSQFSTKITFLYDPLTLYSEAKFVGGKK